MKLDVLLFLFTLLSLVTGDVDSLSNIAVFVLGEHRLYDGTWPSHHRHLYRPIRHHKLTKRFDVFVCQKDGEILPANMPKPTAEFHAPKKFDQVYMYLKVDFSPPSLFNALLSLCLFFNASFSLSLFV